METFKMGKKISRINKFAFLTAIVLASLSASFASVKVVESSPSRLILEWELLEFDTASIGNQTKISFNGGFMATGDSGAPLLMGYPIYIGVPDTLALNVIVTPTELSTVRIDKPVQKRDFTVAADPRFRSQWISDPYYVTLRDYRAARLVLRPVLDVGHGELKLLKKARITIDIPAASTKHTAASWEPRGDYERMVKRLLVNFNTAQGWLPNGAKKRASSKKSASESLPFAINQKLASFKVGDNLESSTKENALIKISGKRLREILGTNVAINSVALYASVKGEMDVLVPPIGDIPTGVFEVPILRYDINRNGVIDDNDYVVAYVSGASDWTFLPSRQYSYAINRFDDYRTYWVTVKDGAGAAMERFAEQPAIAHSVETETFEENIYLRTPTALSDFNHEGGVDFVWKVFNMGRSDTTIRLNLTGHSKNMPGSIQFNTGRIYNHDAAGTATGYGAINASLGAKTLCTNCGGAWASIDSWESDNLTVKYTNTASNGRSYYEINGIHLRYRRSLNLSAVAGKLEILSLPSAAAYRLSKTNGDLAYIVRVPLDEREISLIDTTRSASFLWSDDGGRGVRYMATLEKELIDYSDSIKPFVLGQTASDGFQIRDLRGFGNKTDYLIVTHEEFLSAALKLAEHKAAMGFNHPKVALISDVFNQFGGGNTDPAALRNFLLYVYRHWDGGDAFSYVTLMGIGHYDYKGINTRAVNYIPVPYISGRFNDDYYVFYNTVIHPNSQHDGYYFLGRMPVKNLLEAQNIADKIIEMEAPTVAEFDSWRGRALMLADDDQQGASEDMVRGHHLSSELASAIIEKNRPDIDLKKLYLFEYPWDERYFKPEATRTLINELNNGVAVFNWFGHGSPGLIADERIFNMDDLSALHNRKRYPLVTLFSCSIGKFDHASGDCLAAALVKQPRAGAIAAVSSAREVFASQNEALALPFFGALFDSTQSLGVSIGSALRVAKYKYNTSDNRYYMIFGDPSLTLFKRLHRVKIAVTDANGVALDTLKALQQIKIKGTVQDTLGSTNGSFGNGAASYVNLTLFNPPYTAQRKDGGKYSNPTYTLPGSPVFSAKIPVTNGAFEQPLLLPMNLAFGKAGVKLIAYAYSAQDAATGSGYIDGLIFEGSESGGFSDSIGPKISARPIFENNAAMNQAGMFVKNRITARLPFTLEVNIEDESGINVISSGPDEGLSMEVTGALSKRSVNHLFQFTEGSFKHGTAALAFEENSLKSGVYELIICAQDLIGNVSKLTITLEVTSSADLKLDHVINIPNPVKMGRETKFYFYHSDAPGDMGVSLTIRVYSLGGRLLSVIRNPKNGEPWIPKDQKGNLLTPNIYLYQVSAFSVNTGKTVKSKIKKLAVHPPK